MLTYITELSLYDGTKTQYYFAKSLRDRYRFFYITVKPQFVLHITADLTVILISNTCSTTLEAFSNVH